MIKEELNIVLSCDDNYARHMGCVILSTLQHNVEFEIINFYIVNNGISEQNIENLKFVNSLYSNVKLYYIDFAQWASQLKLDMAWQISLSSYGRLFLGDMLPPYVHKIIYLDCDMIVCQSLLPLWQIDLKFVVGAVQDQVSHNTKKAVGLNIEEKYFNAGMLLINLDEWRRQNVGEKCIQFINSHNGRVVHHDQGVLNGVLRNAWLRLPIKYNIMTIHYICSQKQVRLYFKDNAEFYTREEICEAKNNPVILHYTPSFTSRPWIKGCIHPMKNIYWNTIRLTPWKKVQVELDKRKFLVKLIEKSMRFFLCYFF